MIVSFSLVTPSLSKGERDVTSFAFSKRPFEKLRMT